MSSPPKDKRIKNSHANGTVEYTILYGTIYRMVTLGYSRRLKMAGKWMAEKIKETLSKPWPPASREGQPPAERTGNLKRSIHTDGPFRDALGFEIDIGSPLDYALDLEIGDGEIAPRPFLRPAQDNFAPQAIRLTKGKLI